MSDTITDFVSWITSSKKYATASPRTQKMLFAGFEAGRQADEGQSVGVAESYAPSPGMTQCVFTAKAVPVGAKLYARPVSADAPDAEYSRALQDAFDIIQADANNERNYGSLCRKRSVLARLKSVQEQGQ